jgi:hypothetical protein
MVRPKHAPRKGLFDSGKTVNAMRYMHGRIGRTGVIIDTAGAFNYCSIVEQCITFSVVVKKSFPHFRMGESRPSSSTERAELLEQILASFTIPGEKNVDERWAEEATDRLDAYERGELRFSPAIEVFARLDRGGI